MRTGFYKKISIGPRALFLSILYPSILSAVAGFMLAHYIVDKVYVPVEALRQARKEVNKEMQEACANWYTDKRSTKLIPGRLVVCKAPTFLTATTYLP